MCRFSVPLEPAELVLPDEILDTEIIDWGRLALHNSETGPTIEFLNLGAAENKYRNCYLIKTENIFYISHS